MSQTRGVDRIAAERLRQQDREGFSQQHDASHDCGELISAARAYTHHAQRQLNPRMFSRTAEQVGIPMVWPWSDEWWKPSDDPIRNLEKAGALIAAEIDRLLALKSAVHQA